jgi:hypothetical protein
MTGPPWRIAVTTNSQAKFSLKSPTMQKRRPSLLLAGFQYGDDFADGARPDPHVLTNGDRTPV